jgi:2'-5' RNA ligase
MRVFIAIDVPFDDALKDLTKEFPASLRPVKSFHITLKFLGDADVEWVKGQLDKVQHTPFRLSLGKPSYFTKRKPRILWLSIEGRLEELQQKIDKALQKRFQQERGYKPHLTLARARSADAEQFIASFDKKIDAAWQVEEFTLYSSILTPTGPEYRIEKKYRL